MSVRVMIVDDSSMMRKMVAKLLSEAGHQVVGEARNGLEAVEMYKSLRPDYVTMDITMREMDGLTGRRDSSPGSPWPGDFPSPTLDGRRNYRPKGLAGESGANGSSWWKPTPGPGIILQPWFGSQGTLTRWLGRGRAVPRLKGKTMGSLGRGANNLIEGDKRGNPTNWAHGAW